MLVAIRTVITPAQVSTSESGYSTEKELTEIQVANRQIEGREIRGDQEGRIEFALRDRDFGKAICAFSGTRMHRGHRTIDDRYGKLDDGNEKASSSFLRNRETLAVHIADRTNGEEIWHSKNPMTILQLNACVLVRIVTTRCTNMGLPMRLSGMAHSHVPKAQGYCSCTMFQA